MARVRIPGGDPQHSDEPVAGIEFGMCLAVCSAYVALAGSLAADVEAGGVEVEPFSKTGFLSALHRAIDVFALHGYGARKLIS